MKALKLIIIFIVILGGVVGALYLISGTGGSVLPPPPDNTYQTVRTQIEKDWEEAGDWNDSVYYGHCDLVRQLSRKYETSTLQDLTTKAASGIVYDKIFNEWSSPQCRDAVVKKYIDAIDIIESKDDNATLDPNIKKIKNVYATYKAARNLAQKETGLRPRFDGDQWNSFSAHRQKLINERNSIMADPNYTSYLANILYIKNGLNSMPDRLDKSRNRFYEDLAIIIIQHYSQTPSSEWTSEGLTSLRNTNSRYTREYKSNSRLSDFTARYAREVSDNESRYE